MVVLAMPAPTGNAKRSPLADVWSYETTGDAKSCQPPPSVKA